MKEICSITEKNVININIVLCGKKYNSKESCSLFKIYDEYQYYQMKYEK